MLAGPVNQLTDFQAEYNGLLLGPGTAYLFNPGLDWLDMPGIRSMDTNRDWADGAWSGPDFADVRIFNATVDIASAPVTAFQAACAAYVNAFTVAATDVPFWQKLPGFPVMGIGARVVKRSLPIDIGFELGTLATAALQFRAPNPAWQSIPRATALTASGSSASGLVAPIGSSADGSGTDVLDSGILGAVSFTSILTNAGNAPAWPVITVAGPCPGGFTLTVAAQAVTYGIDVAAGQTVVVDYGAGTAVLADGADRTYALTARGFTSIPASGSRTVSFIAASGTAVVMTADMWR